MRLPTIQREVDEGEGFRDPGVVHYDVATAALAIYDIEGGSDRCGVADVDPQRRGDQASARQRFGLGPRLRLVDVADQYMHALLRKNICDGRADPLCCSGDERDPLRSLV